MLLFTLRTLLLTGCVTLSLLKTRAAEPMPPTALLEDFAKDPAAAGWLVFGDTNLFHWNTPKQYLEVTWDSSKPNSFFYRPLGTTLTRRHDFSLSFDLRLQDIAVGTTPGKPYTFELALGLLNMEAASSTSFVRGTGTSSPNLFEFDYFPDSGFGATIAPTIISSNMVFASSFNAPLELTLNDLFRVTMVFDGDDGELKTSVTRNGAPFGPVKSVVLGPEFTDFRVDHLAIISYSDAGQDPQFSGSIRAHGIVDNLLITLEQPAKMDMDLAGRFVGGQWQVEFTARPEWTYALYRTADFISWTLVAKQSVGSSGKVTLADADPPPVPAQFYRLLADRP